MRIDMASNHGGTAFSRFGAVFPPTRDIISSGWQQDSAFVYQQRHDRGIDSNFGNSHSNRHGGLVFGNVRRPH